MNMVWGKDVNEEEKDSKGHISDSDSDSESVETSDNHIYFYSEVNRSSVLELNRNISKLENELEALTNKFKLPHATIPIYIHLNSYGGQVHAAMSAVDKILCSTIPITTIVEGCAASAATLISVVGDKRIITPHSCMLIHELSSMFWGKHHEFLDEVKNLNMLMEQIKDIYKEHTKITKTKMCSLLKKDLWLSSETCLKYGLVDEIGNEKQNKNTH
jgi:ATP-dependent protease ClpP protease subunit